MTSTGSNSQNRAQTMPLQGVVNRVVRGLMCVPGLGAVIGARLITLYIVGRKSGKHYDIPVAYTPHEGMLLIGTEFAWGRNLRTGEPLEVRYLGKRRTADVVVVTDEDGVTADYATICRANRNFAKFGKIAIDSAGNPDPGDLRRAWQSGGRAFRLTIR